ncbi:MAG: hypothetical protein R3D57_08685 [Hyphomicrobiaceae bacterium]
MRPVAALIDDIAYRLVLTTVAGMSLMAIVSALYLAKSAMGIDLMDGPSPLHGLFFG